MLLTPLQRTILENFQLFRDRPPTAWRLFALSAARISRPADGIGFIAAFWLVLGQWDQVWIIAALAIGLALRDYQLNRMSTCFWPVLEKVLDWKKVDELVWVEADCSPADWSLGCPASPRGTR